MSSTTFCLPGISENPNTQFQVWSLPVTHTTQGSYSYTYNIYLLCCLHRSVPLEFRSKINVSALWLIFPQEEKSGEKAGDAKEVKLYGQIPPIEKMDASLSTLTNCEWVCFSLCVSVLYWLRVSCVTFVMFVIQETVLVNQLYWKNRQPEWIK